MAQNLQNIIESYGNFYSNNAHVYNVENEVAKVLKQ